MDRNRVTLMFIGILVCVPVLAMYQFGLFPELSAWLGGQLPRLLVLPEDGLRSSLLLQYGYYTALAFICAWAGLEMRALWQKFAFLCGLTYLTISLTVTLAWLGVLFEPFSGLMAAWVACLVAVMVADAGKANVTSSTEAPVVIGAETKEG